MTNGRIWTGVLAGVLAAGLLFAVGIGAYRAGQDDEAVERVVQGSEGEVVRVVRDHDWNGPGPGFFLFPLFIILLVVLFVRLGRRGWGHGGWGHGGWHGPHGYGPAGYGPPGYGPPDERREWLEEWHRREHGGGSDDETTESTESATRPDPTTSPPPSG